MALLRLDLQRYELEVKVGVLEEYQPDREIKAIFNKLNKLKEQAEKKIATLVKADKDTPLNELQQKLSEDEKANEKFKQFVEAKFVPEMKKLINRINKKNEKICPGFKDKVKELNK